MSFKNCHNIITEMFQNRQPIEETTSDEAWVIDLTADSGSDSEPMMDTRQSVTRYL